MIATRSQYFEVCVHVNTSSLITACGQTDCLLLQVGQQSSQYTQNMFAKYTLVDWGGEDGAPIHMPVVPTEKIVTAGRSMHGA